MKTGERGFVKRLFRLVAVIVLATVTLGPVGVTASDGQAQEAPPAASSVDDVQPATGRVYFPYVSKAQPPPYRIGYNALDANNVRYSAVNQLNAGWYLNWTVQTNPPRPQGIEFVQTIRVHQKLTCPLYSPDAWNRDLCPYAQPYDYLVNPNRTAITQAVQANRSTLWLIGNEMDRRDWPVEDPPSTSGQDEMLPETYARAYHDLYTLIKSVDPSAKVAIGGVIQATPQRLTYLTRIWDSYQQQYGTTMPVDIWNVHNFILPEYKDGSGAGVPPGMSEDGVKYTDPLFHTDMQIFDKQIRAFRGWMKDRGQQDKPLIVSEYGVLYPEWYVPEYNAAGVGDFMIATFDYFLKTADCSLGQPSDGCRLVQRWAWYSLDDNGDGFNAYGALFNRNTTALSETGRRYRDWVATHRGELN
jgi:hypothetical protein